jgi:hypothetical protein
VTDAPLPWTGAQVSRAAFLGHGEALFDAGTETEEERVGPRIDDEQHATSLSHFARRGNP